MAGFSYTLTLADRFSDTFDSWDKGLRAAAQNAETASSRMERAVSVAMAGIGVAIMASVPAMAASFIPLEEALARLKTVSTTTFGDLDAAMAKSLAQAREWSSQHVQSTTEVIEAQFEFATAGLKVEAAMAGVTRAAALATATGDGLKETSQFLASLFSTLGEGGKGGQDPAQFFERIGDSAAEAIKRFQMTMVPLRQGMGFITAQMTEMGYTGTRAFTEAAVALGILNTAGIRGTAAGAGMSNILLRIGKSVEKLGLDINAFTDAEGKFTNFTDYFNEVNRALQKAGTPLQQLIAANEAFGIRGARTALVLAQQSQALGRNTTEIMANNGQMDKMRGIIEETAGARLQILLNNLKNFAQTVGEGLNPALKALIDAGTWVFKTLTDFAGGSKVAAAMIIFLTGTVIAATAAWGIFQTVMVATGANAATMRLVMGGLASSFLTIVRNGAIAAVALTLLANLFKSSPEIEGKGFAGIEKTNFSPVVKGIQAVAAEARKAEEDFKALYTTMKGVVEPGNINFFDRIGLAGTPQTHNPDGSISTVHSMGVGFGDTTTLIPTVSNGDPSHLMETAEAIEAYRQSGMHLGKFLTDADADAAAETIHKALANAMGLAEEGGRGIMQHFHDAIVGGLQTMGVSEPIGEEFAKAAEKAVVELHKMGVSVPDAMAGAGEAMADFSKLVLGENADAWNSAFADILASEKVFVEKTNALLGSGAKTGSEALAAIRNAPGATTGLGNRFTTGVMAGYLQSGDYVSVISKNFSNDLGDAAKHYLEAQKELVDLFNDKTQMEALAKVSPDLAKMVRDMGDQIRDGTANMQIDFAGAFIKRDGGKFEQVGQNFGSQLFRGMLNFINTNDVGAPEILAPVIEKMRASIGQMMGGATGAAFQFDAAKGMARHLQELSGEFTKVGTDFTAAQEEMKKGFDANQVRNLESLSKQMLAISSAQKEGAASGRQWSENVLKMLPDLPERFRGLEPVLKTMVKFFQDAGLAAERQVTEVEGVMNAYRGLSALMEGQGKFSKEILSSGGKVFEDALSSSLTMGDTTKFGETLYKKTYESLKSGIIEGVAEGFLVASHMRDLFDKEEIKKQFSDAIGQATVVDAKGKGHLDPAAAQRAFAPIFDRLASGAGGFEDMSKILPILTAGIDRVATAWAGATGQTKAYQSIVVEAASESVKGLQEQERAIGTLQASLLTASIAQRQFIEAQLALKRGEGIVLGTDVSKLDLQGQARLLEHLVDLANRAGQNESARALQSDLAKVYEQIQKGEDLSKALKISEANVGVAGFADTLKRARESLDKPVGISKDISTMASDMELARKAAAGFREELAAVTKLNTAVNVQGGGANQTVSIALGGIQIQLDVGAAITQENLNALERRVDDEMKTKTEEIKVLLRSQLPRK